MLLKKHMQFNHGFRDGIIGRLKRIVLCTIEIKLWNTQILQVILQKWRFEKGTYSMGLFASLGAANTSSTVYFIVLQRL